MLFSTFYLLLSTSAPAAPQPTFELKLKLNGDIVSSILPSAKIINVPNDVTFRVHGDDLGTGSIVSDGDKGDISVSGAGGVWTIDPNTVSLAKLADMATASFLGRNTAGTGDPEVLSIFTVKTMLGIAGTFGSAAYLNVPASGDAASGEAVKGSDSRLTNARTPSLGAQLSDNAAQVSVDANARTLIANDGVTPQMDWSEPGVLKLFGGADNDGLTYTNTDSFRVNAVMFANAFVGDGSQLTNLPSTRLMWSGETGPLVSNTTAETSLMVSATNSFGSPNVASFSGGQVYEIEVSGVISTTSGTVGNLTIYLYDGNQTLVAIIAPDLASSQTNKPFRFNATVLVFDSGGICRQDASFQIAGSSSGSQLLYMQSGIGGGGSGFTAGNLDVRAKWATASSSNKIQMAVGTIKVSTP